MELVVAALLVGCGPAPDDAPEPGPGELTGIAYDGGGDTFPLSLVSPGRPITDRLVVAVPVEGFERLREHTDLPPDADITVLGDGRVMVPPDGLADSGSAAAPLDDAGHFRLALDPGEYALCLASGEIGADIGLEDCAVDEVEVPQRVGLERVTGLLYVRHP